MDFITELGLPKSIKGKTFAEAAKHIEKMFEGRSNPIDSSTKKSLMNRLRTAQETIKQQQQQSEQGQNQLAYGGGVDINQLSRSGYNPASAETAYTPNFSEEQLQSYANEPEMQDQPNWFSRNKNTISTIAGLGLSAAPLITNALAMKNLKRADNVRANTLDKELTPHFINRQQIERNLVNQLAGQRQALQQSSSGNIGQYAANLQALHGGTSQALANATLQANIADTQERARVEQGNIGIDQFNLQQQSQADTLNAQNEAAYQTQMDAYRQAQSQSLANIGKSLFNYSQANQYSDEMAKTLKLLGLQAKNLK